MLACSLLGHSRASERARARALDSETAARTAQHGACAPCEMALPTKQQGSNPSLLLPSELVDKCVGSRIWVRPGAAAAAWSCA